MGQSQQESEGESEGQSRSRERINRSGEEEREKESEREGSTLRQSVGTFGFGRNTAVGTESVDNGATGDGETGHDLVNYDPGPDADRLSRRYDVDLGADGGFEKIQRLEREFGAQRVHRWADEGMTIDTMGKPRDMAAFRERQADRPEAVPDDIERQNRASRRRNEGRQDDGPAGSSAVPDEIRRVVASRGRSLEDTVQREMEEKMGGDFQDVQVHTGPQAAAAADSINARAFTVGNHVAFNRGEYQPSSDDGKKVLAHELTHVRQQTEGAVSLLPQAGVEHPGAVGLAGDWHVQPKLEVSSPDDPAEKEAERVAEQVVEMGDASSGSAGSASDDEAASRQDEDSDGQQGEANRQEGSESGGEVDVGLVRTVPVSRSPAGGGEVDGEGESAVRSAVQGGGKPLPSETRGEMESKMGADFSDVSVHTGPEADAAARSINAEAYTMGSNIAFAEGNYEPDSKSGKKLLAHELTHVAQQSGGASASVDRVQRQAGGMSMASSTGEPTYRVSINGEMVQVQGGTIHVVERGDNLSEIAAQYGVSGGWKPVYDLNRDVIGPDPNLIHPGDVLLIPNTGWQMIDPSSGTGGESADGESSESGQNQSLPQGGVDTDGENDRESGETGVHDLVEDLGVVDSLEGVKNFFIELINLDTKLKGKLWFELPIQTPWGRLDTKFTVNLEGSYKVEDDIYGFKIGGAVGVFGDWTIPHIEQGIEIGLEMGPNLDIQSEDPIGIWEMWRLAVREDIALALKGFFAVHPVTAGMVGNEWHHVVSPETLLAPIKDLLLADEQAEEIMLEMSDDEKLASSFKVEGKGSGAVAGAEAKGALGAEMGRERTSEEGEFLDEEDYFEGSFSAEAETPNGWGGKLSAKAKFYDMPPTDEYEAEIAVEFLLGNLLSGSELADQLGTITQNVEGGLNQLAYDYIQAAANSQFLPYLDVLEEGFTIAFADDVADSAGGGGGDGAGKTQMAVSTKLKWPRGGGFDWTLALVEKSSISVESLLMGAEVSQETVILQGELV